MTPAGPRRSAIAGRLCDVRAAILALPTRDAWRRCAWAYLVFLLAAAPLAWLAGLIQPSLPTTTPRAAAVLIGTVFVHPALSEEIVFRALLLPRRPEATERVRLSLAVIVALALYVASHPITAWLLRPAALPLFSSPSYLVLAALLGLACTAAYLMSGSIWPPVLMHWTTVVGWLVLLGGLPLLS